MKKSELREALKPLIKEVMLEVLLTEGILSSLISETVSGVLSAEVLSEAVGPKVEQEVVTEHNIPKPQSDEMARMRKEMAGLKMDSPFAALVNTAKPIPGHSSSSKTNEEHVDSKVNDMVNNAGVDLSIFKEIGIDFG